MMLYRETYGTFEEYCRERWQFERAHAYRLIKASEVAQNLSPVGDIPKSERTIRPLTIIKDPEEQREVYQKAVETAPEVLQCSIVDSQRFTGDFVRNFNI